jgi:hypothetical protein
MFGASDPCFKDAECGYGRSKEMVEKRGKIA